jgi:hypothetical protein
MKPTYVGTLEQEDGSFHVVILNFPYHITLNAIMIAQAKERGVHVEQKGKDVCFSPMIDNWTESDALSMRDKIEFCLLSNGFNKMFDKCDGGEVQ